VADSLYPFVKVPSLAIFFEPHLTLHIPGLLSNSFASSSAVAITSATKIRQLTSNPVRSEHPSAPDLKSTLHLAWLLQNERDLSSAQSVPTQLPFGVEILSSPLHHCWGNFPKVGVK